MKNEKIKQKKSELEAIEVENKTVEEAIQKGLEILGLPKEKVDIKILDEGTCGLFGLMGAKPAKVKLQPKRSSISKNIITEIESFLRTYFTKLIELFGIKSKTYESKFIENENILKINLNLQDERLGSLLIGKSGKTLQALNTIIQAILNNKYKNSQKTLPKINIDINNYYLKQEEKLKNIINKAITIVRKTKKPYRLVPMSRESRKFIHLFFKDSKEFETISEGEGSQRRVIIKPKKQ